MKKGKNKIKFNKQAIKQMVKRLKEKDITVDSIEEVIPNVS
jgi:hypothetical protein